MVKALLSGVVIIVLVIGAPWAYATSGTTDSDGRPCDFGARHDQCLAQYAHDYCLANHPEEYNFCVEQIS